MKIAPDQIEICCHEPEIYNRLLTLVNKHILELGCGNANITRKIATSGVNRSVTALEVDVIAHQKNLQLTDLPNVTFELSGAQQIPLADESVDVVFMFKSLHHVPVDMMEISMHEIRRVLKPGGFAYISEPVFAGEFNAIMRLFNDEKVVRQAAFRAVKKAVDTGLFDLVEEVFFNSPRIFVNFVEFDNNIIKATHSDHKLDDGLYERVRQNFEKHMGEDGANFLNPMRVDLLQKAGVSSTPVY